MMNNDSNEDVYECNKEGTIKSENIYELTKYEETVWANQTFLSRFCRTPSKNEERLFSLFSTNELIGNIVFPTNTEI